MHVPAGTPNALWLLRTGNPDRRAAFKGAGKMRINENVSERIRRELTDRGHKVEITKGPIGNPVMIHIDHESGVIRAAGDPKAGRHASAW